MLICATLNPLSLVIVGFDWFVSVIVLATGCVYINIETGASIDGQ